MNSARYEWSQWPVYWSAVWVGALTALAVGLIIGLLGYAFGAHAVATSVDWKKIGFASLVFSVGGAFFAFVAGGWAAGRIAGIRLSEPAILHAAIVWLVTLPLLVGFGAIGALGHFGGWYGGLSGIPPWVTSVSSNPDLATATRNDALATAAALLIGLIGAVIGSWMASGEPMTFTHYRRTDRLERTP